MSNIRALAEKSAEVAKTINNSDYKRRHLALSDMAEALRQNSGYILEENEKDLARAREAGMSDALYDRLTITEERITSMADAIDDVKKLPDCLGEVLSMQKRPNGLTIGQMRVSMGVIAIIYEARPNVTADAAALCVKTGNAVILRGGKEAINSNTAIVSVLRGAIKPYFPEDVIALVTDTSRESATELMRLNGLVDVLIPRGGAGLIKSVIQNATIPVIETGTGNCHIYVEKSGDFEKAVNILINAKTQRPGVCNAAESLVVDKDIAADFLPKAYEALKNAGVSVVGCKKTRGIIDVPAATEEDFGREYLDLKISCYVADGIDDAIDHINKYSTGHSEAIITENYSAAQKFLQKIDSAAVYVNASTRFTDGGEFGFGCEIGISTQKLHARGPMGLDALTSYKYILKGNGQTR